MKPLIVALLVGTQAVLLAGARECAFRVLVCDEDGLPVSNAVVGVDFTRFSGTTAIVTQRAQGLTGTNGIWEYQGACPGKIGWGVEKTGYYRSFGPDIRFTNETLLGRLEPWNRLFTIQLRRVIAPIPMYARQTGQQHPPLKIPAFGKSIGFDLIRSDWVSPYGTGLTPDFTVWFTATDATGVSPEYYKAFPRAGRYKDTDFRLTFVNDGDGLLSVSDDPGVSGSAFRLSRYAPVSGYSSSLVFSAKAVFTNGHIECIGDKWNAGQNYLFRVRSQRDKDGVITNSLYGKIRGPIVCLADGRIEFTYYLNPVPNDRNLEYDAKNNLLKGVLGARENPPPGP